MKILLIEDSERLLRSLGKGLRASGFAVDTVADGLDGLDLATIGDYDAIILDLMLPGLDGLGVLKRLRAAGRHTPVLILSARDQLDDRVNGLDVGADDYLVKPFEFDELVARLRALVRRRAGAPNPEVTLGPVVINTARKIVTRDGEAVALTRSEYVVLEYLSLNRGRVISKRTLLDHLHDRDRVTGTNLIEVIVHNVRRKLGATKDAPVIRTRRGHGYLID